MTTPAQRVPVRVTRGTKSELDAVVADLKEGEVCYATDQEILYVVEGGVLVGTSTPSPVYSDTTQALNGDDPILTPDQVDNIVRVASEGDYDGIATKDADCLYVLPAPAVGQTVYLYNNFTGGNVTTNGDYTTSILGFITFYFDVNGNDIREDPAYQGIGNLLDVYFSSDGVSFTVISDAQPSDNSGGLAWTAFNSADGFDTAGPLYIALGTDPSAGGGGNGLVAASGDAVNYIGEWTGNGTSQSIVSPAELSVVHVGSQGLRDVGLGGSLYFNLGAGGTDLPVGANKNIQTNFSFAAPDTNIFEFTGSGFNVGTSTRTNNSGTLNVSFGIRKDGEQVMVNGAGPDSTVYLAEGEGVQVVQWYSTGAGSDTVLHGCGATPDIIFWNGADGNDDGDGDGAWYINGAVFNTTTTYASDAQGAWRLRNTSNTGSDRLMSFDDSSFTTCSNTYSEFNGSNMVFTALCFYNVTGKSQTGRLSGPGGSALSVNLGFRPKVVWWKPVDGSELWQQQMDNASSTGNTWGGIGEGWNVSTDITITANGFDLASGAVGNDGSGEGVYVAFR